MGKTIGLLSVIAALAFGTGARSLAQTQPEGLDSRKAAGSDPLVRVDDHVITRAELQTYFEGFYADRRMQEHLRCLPPLERGQFLALEMAKALPELVEQHLLVAAAKEEYPNLEPVQKAVDEILARRLRELSREQGSLMAVVQSFHDRGITLEEWKHLLSDAILVQNYVRPRIQSRLRVSPTDMRRYYEQDPGAFRRPRRVAYRLIIVDPAGCETPEQERAKAQSILERLRLGADFAELAEQYSIDRDQTDGGLHEVDAPLAPPDWLPPPCAGLEPGQLSELRPTEAGYCIARLESIVPSRIPPFDEVQAEVRAILLERKTREAEREVIERLRSKAVVEYLPAGNTLLGH